MEIEKTNKVTEMAKKNGKSNARGEKCLADVYKRQPGTCIFPKGYSCNGRADNPAP